MHFYRIIRTLHFLQVLFQFLHKRLVRTVTAGHFCYHHGGRKHLKRAPHACVNEAIAGQKPVSVCSRLFDDGVVVIPSLLAVVVLQSLSREALISGMSRLAPASVAEVARTAANRFDTT